MVCEVCGDKEATIHLTQMINEEVKKVHLCETCAAESGLDVNSPVSITDVLLGLGAQKEASNGAVKNKTCPRCHMRFTDFKKTSRLGCEACYETFAEELEPLLAAMHKGGQHIGKIPAAGSSVEVSPALVTPVNLKKSLDDAVAAENYEEAARIRDQIRQLTEGKAAGERNA